MKAQDAFLRTVTSLAFTQEERNRPLQEKAKGFMADVYKDVDGAARQGKYEVTFTGCSTLPEAEGVVIILTEMGYTARCKEYCEVGVSWDLRTEA